MTTKKLSTKQKPTGFFKAWENDHEIYNSNSVDASHDENYVTIQSVKDPNNPGREGFHLLIKLSIKNGEHRFPHTDIHNFFYRTNNGSNEYRPTSGTFTVNIDDVSRRYRMTFNLEFTYGSLKKTLIGEFDIEGLRPTRQPWLDRANISA